MITVFDWISIDSLFSKIYANLKNLSLCDGYLLLRTYKVINASSNLVLWPSHKQSDWKAITKWWPSLSHSWVNNINLGLGWAQSLQNSSQWNQRKWTAERPSENALWMGNTNANTLAIAQKGRNTKANWNCCG